MAMALLGSKKTNYAYAVARVQAKRGRLIPRNQYDKLLKMNLAEITRFIQDSEYKDEVDELAARFGGLDLLEAALTVNEERSYNAVRRMLAGEGGAIVSAFLVRNLVDDIKAVLRGKQSGATRDELLKEMLLEDLDTFNIFQPLIAEDVRTIDDVIEAMDRQGGIASTWARVLRKVPSGSSLPAYEDALDKAYFARLLEAADGFSQKGAQVLLEFVRREIDSRNLQNAARWVQNGGGADFSDYVIPGGKHLKVADVMALASCSDLAALDDALQSNRFYEELQDGLEQAQQTGRQAPLALAIRRAFFKSIDQLAHANPLSILPILTFLVRKRQEVVTLRALARGKAAGLSEARLKELIE